MVKKALFLVMLFAFILSASGCVTISAENVYVDGKSPGCITKGGKTEKGPNIVEKADNWVKENIW